MSDSSSSGVLRNIGWLARCEPSPIQSEIQPLDHAAIAWKDGVIDWVGRESDLPEGLGDRREYTASGRAVIPGLIDAHTHLVFGGWRPDEFRQRIEGVSYLDIAAAGGGIRKTMRQTRGASEEALKAHAHSALAGMLELGVTTIECKTGYGLSFEDELRLLRVIRALDDETPQSLIPTLLAAHVVPDASECDADCYVDMIVERLIPAVAEKKLARFNDVFVEEGAFTAEQAIRVLKAGQALGLDAKLHVDQLGDGGGGHLAASLGANSADHLEYTSAEGRAAMAEAGTVAVCLPFASLYLNQPPMDGRAFVEDGVQVAVATDFNPGSAPSYDLPLALMLACTMSRLTPAEALAGATRVAARAVGESANRGSIALGMRADFAELSTDNVDQWLYHFRPNVCAATWIGGQRVHAT